MTQYCEEPFRWINDREGYAIAAGSLILLIIIWSLDSRVEGVFAAAAAGSLGISLRMSWHLWKHHWFRFLAAAIAGAHLAVFLFYPWTSTISPTGAEMYPIMVLDTALTLSIVYLFYRVFEGRPARIFGPSGATSKRYADVGD
jgi:hypothetical protein